MGTIDGKKSIARSEEEGCDSHAYSRRGGHAGLQSQTTRNKPQRTDRADSEESNFFGTGRAATGGILSQLISEYRDQVAIKKQEIDRLEGRIDEFEALLDELQQRAESES